MPSNDIIVYAGVSNLRWTDGRGVERATTHRHPGMYAREDDWREGSLNAQYPQICYGGARTGNTIEFARRREDVPRQFAADLGGRLVEDREEYEAERDRRAKAERKRGLTQAFEDHPDDEEVAEALREVQDHEAGDDLTWRD